MRIAKMKLIKIFAVMLLLTASALWLCRDSLSAHYHLRALRHAEKQVFAPGPTTFLQGVSDFLFRRPNWDAICSHHENALIRMGYFASRDFPLTNQRITGVQLRTNAESRFGSQFYSIMVITNGQSLTSTTVASNSFVRIIAPADEMGDWNTLILKLDEGRL